MCKEDTENFIGFRLHVGSCKFWFDNWTDCGRLAELNYSLVNPKALVADFSNNSCWNSVKLCSVLDAYLSYNVLKLLPP
jgi:hypothetical protein